MHTARGVTAAECLSQSESLSELEYGIGCNVRVFNRVRYACTKYEVVLAVGAKREAYKKCAERHDGALISFHENAECPVFES